MFKTPLTEAILNFNGELDALRESIANVYWAEGVQENAYALQHLHEIELLLESADIQLQYVQLAMENR